MKKSFLLFSLILPALSWATYPAGYYNSLDGKSGSALRTAIKNIANGHKEISYSSGTWDAFLSTDVRSVNGKDCWWDMYSSDNVAVSSGHPGMNVEHSVANSWWGGTKNAAYKDIVHLNPSNSNANSRKSNYPLGEIGTGTWDNGITFIGKPKSGSGGGNSYVYEPHDMYKGDFARVFMYMFITYSDISWKSNTAWMYTVGSPVEFQPWAVEMLLRWNVNDPVSQKELDRNDGIYKEQKNRNPFIDLPDLPDYIWGNKKGETFYLNSDHTPVTPDPVEPDPVNPDPVNPDPVNPGSAEGTWYLVTDASQLEAGENYIIVSATDHYGMTYTIAGTSNPYYSPTDAKCQVSGGVISSLPAGIAVATLSGSKGNYTFYLSDAAGNGKGYLGASDAKKMTLSATSGSPIDITVASDGKAKLDFGEYELLYNTSSPRFTTYAAPGNFSDDLTLYRLKKAEPTPPEPFELYMPTLFAIDHNGEEISDGSKFENTMMFELSYPEEHSDAAIFYTLDGSEPQVDAEQSQSAHPSTMYYKVPVDLYDTTTIKAVGVKNKVVSPVLTATFTRSETTSVERLDDSFLVEVWGRNILMPEGAECYDLNGRRCNGENLAPGIYIVAKKGFAAPVKVLIK